MPEIAEVEKLRRQIEPAWKGTKVVGFKAPRTSKNPKKYVQGSWEEFTQAVKSGTIKRIDRLGKNLWVDLGREVAWHIHLSSTGWFMPGNDKAWNLSKIDPIHKNFLHAINQDNVRLVVVLSDGQWWNYHDPRTWGKFQILRGKGPREHPFFSKVGPDWLKEGEKAVHYLAGARAERSTLKDVLTDQKVTAGIGNYLACEVAFLVGLHPLSYWRNISTLLKIDMGWKAHDLIQKCLDMPDHSHWNVFKRAGEPCRRCSRPIEYTKDGRAERGSYYCPKCQPIA